MWTYPNFGELQSTHLPFISPSPSFSSYLFVCYSTYIRISSAFTTSVFISSLKVGLIVLCLCFLLIVSDAVFHALINFRLKTKYWFVFLCFFSFSEKTESVIAQFMTVRRVYRKKCVRVLKLYTFCVTNAEYA